MMMLAGWLGPSCAAPPGVSSGESAARRVKVSVVELGRGVGPDKHIDRPAEAFFPEDPVYASVTTRGKGRVALTARFLLEDGRVVHEATQDIAPDGPAVSEFHVMNPAGWPVGTHRVEILIDGRLEATHGFTVTARPPR